MDIFQKMLNTQALMFIYMAFGFAVSRTKVLGRQGRQGLSAVLINVTLPCMILHSFETKVTGDELIRAAQALIVSALVCIIAYFAGQLLWRNKPEGRKSILLFGTMFSNAGNAGLPIIALVFGDTGVFYASFFLIPLRILMWTLGLGLFVKGEGKQKWKALLFNPSLIVVFVGLMLMAFQWNLPSLISTAITNVGNMTGPLSMMIIGATLANMTLKDVCDKDVWLLSLLRLLGIPLVLLGMLRFVGVDTIIWQISVVLLSMPVAANTAILAEIYGRDTAFASKCVFVSTLLSILTVPCLTLLF